MKKQCLKHEYIGAFYRQTFNVDSCPYCKIAILREALERIATILPFSPADGFHCKTIAQKALQRTGGGE